MSNAVDHTCVADHCVACCPTAQGYSSGFNDARAWFGNEHRMRLLDGPRIELLIIALLIIVSVVLLIKVRSLSHAH